VKTIKQLADEFGVKKDKVKYRVGKLPENLLVNDRGITYVTDEGIEQLRDLLGVKTEKKTEEFTGEITASIVGMLRDELAAKNRQIEDLTAALRAAQQTAAAAQALHAATVQQNIESDAVKQRERGFFGRIFGKKEESRDA